MRYCDHGRVIPDGKKSECPDCYREQWERDRQIETAYEISDATRESTRIQKKILQNLQQAKMTISSHPPDADIELDGAFVGNTPSAIGVPSGVHTVKITKNGYFPWTKKIQISSGDINLNAEFVPLSDEVSFSEYSGEQVQIQCIRCLESAVYEELGMLALSALAAAGGSGAAVTFREGRIDEVVCRAKSGYSAPDVGVVLPIGNSLRLCIQYDQEFRCDDATADSRIDRAAIGVPGMRSMLALPIRGEKTILGILFVFSSIANCFGDVNREALRTVVNQMAMLIDKARQ